MSKILKVRARQVFDSRGNPTIEAEVFTKINSWIASTIKYLTRSNFYNFTHLFLIKLSISFN